MLAIKDSDHVVRYSAYQLAQLARKSETEILESLKVLSSPDSKRLEKQEFNGKRIKAVEDGWLILNGEKYRAKVSDEMRKARLRRAQSAFRERKRSGGRAVGPLKGELAAIRAEEHGHQDAADAITSDALPKGKI